VIDVVQVVIRAGQPADLPAISALLQHAKLPIEDLTNAPGLKFWVLEMQGELAGAVALEGIGREARLLRSLIVAPGQRGRGLARALAARVEQDARAEGIEQLVLLTETAQALFQRLGYRVIERAAAPEPLQWSAEFRSLCPATAICMAKRLSAAGG
jgi:amino-acid N-acetyltransferase